MRQRKPGKRKTGKKVDQAFASNVKTFKRVWVRSKNAHYAARLMHNAMRIRKKFEKKGLTLNDAKFLAEVHAGMISKSAAKKVLAKHGMASLEGFAKEFLAWYNRPGGGYTLLQRPVRETAFVEHLEKKIGTDLRKAKFTLSIYQERIERPSITGATVLDAKVNMEEFARLEKEVGRRKQQRPGEHIVIWNLDNIKYFILRLKEFKLKFGEDVRHFSVKEFQKAINTNFELRIDELKDILERYDLGPKQELEIANEMALKERFKEFLIQLAGRERLKLKLKGK